MNIPIVSFCKAQLQCVSAWQFIRVYLHTNRSLLAVIREFYN